MKRAWASCGLVLLEIFVIVLIVTCIHPPAGHYDFSLRMNELACVRQRVDPYAVWSERVSLPPYYANTHVGTPPAGCTRQVNAYAPWVYVEMLPFSWLTDISEGVAWSAYCALMAVAFAFLVWLAHRGVEDCQDATVLSAIPLLVVAYTIWSNTSVGNFVIVVLAASVAMAAALNRGHDVLAGICWATIMLKPQIGLIFAVPLMMRGKLKTVFVAGAICLLLSVVSSHICRAPLWNLLVQGPAANTSFFLGCGTWPYLFCSSSTTNHDIVLALLIGTVVCLALTALLGRERDWIIFLMPAAITSCCWTYTQAYSHAMGWFVAFVLVREILRRPHSRLLWCLAALAVASLSRFPLAAYGLCKFQGWPFPLSENAFRIVDSLNSTLSLVLAGALCFVIRNRNTTNAAL